MQELSQEDFDNIMDRYPSFELSYETIAHKKVSPSYNICLAIPHGRKYLLWYTFYGTENVCFLLYMNKEKRFTKIVNTGCNLSNHNNFANLCLGTILYGSIIDDTDAGLSDSNSNSNSNSNGNSKTQGMNFIIEDIYYYAGIPLRKSNFRERWDFIYQFISKNSDFLINKNGISISLPFIWENKVDGEFECSPILPTFVSENTGYIIHHIQYRCFLDIMPYLNILVTRKVNLAQVVKSQPVKQSIVLPVFETESFVCDYSRPQYRYPTVFQVSADLQYDIYHLFAFGKNGKPVYYGVAGIPNFKTSIFMNSIFRKIKENENLDAIEESDDEDDFQDIAEDKFVDLNKIELMECVFHTKFKKWVPLRVVENFSKIVHITRLIKDEQQVYYGNNINSINNNFEKQSRNMQRPLYNNNQNRYNQNGNQNRQNRFPTQSFNRK